MIHRSTWERALTELRQESIELLAVDTALAPGDRVDASLRWLQATLPALATLAIVDPGAARQVFALGRSGTDGVVLAGATDQPGVLRRAADRAVARALARRVERSLPDTLDPLLPRSLVRSIERASDGCDESALAEPEGLSVASLRRRLRAGKLPTPGRILRWGRLFCAVQALEREGETVERVAHRFGYSSGAALGRAIRRDVGVSTTTLNDRGGLACALEAFLRSLGG